jgi:hypothetical protein
VAEPITAAGAVLGALGSGVDEMAVVAAAARRRSNIEISNLWTAPRAEALPIQS